MPIRLFFAFVVLLKSNVLACTLPDESPIRVGCSIACGDSYRDTIGRVAQSLGYKVEFSTISRGEGLQSSLQNVDALVSPGGHDIDPRFYTKSKRLSQNERDELFHLHEKLGNDGNSTLAHFARDEHEYRIMRTYFTHEGLKSVPLLGVATECR